MSIKLALAVVGLMCALASRADAHAFLVRSDPAVGAALSAGPKMLRLEFSEPIELVLSGIDLVNRSGAPIMAGKPRFADATKKVLAVDLTELPPGSYRVRWHVVSIDTHRTEGDFTFSLQ
jgi:methionine-rich copper-binding protein CopC